MNIHISDALRRRIAEITASRKLAANGRLLVEEGVLSSPGFPDAHVDIISNWAADPFRSRTWQWRNASFNFVPGLIAYHADDGSDRAIDFAMRALTSWNEAIHGELKQYEFARHDHATARQAENLLLLLVYMVMAGVRSDVWPDIEAMIQDNTALLADDDFYSRHTNHGIEQARILAVVSDCLCDRPQSSTYMTLALQRLEDELMAAFTKEGVHVENSPGYHGHVALSFIKVLEHFPRERLGSLAARIDATMPNAASFLAHVTRPDGTYPIIGDTQRLKVPNYFGRYADSEEFAALQYAISDGSSGKPAQETVAFYPEAGYLVVRDAWYPEGEGSFAFHFLFRCGFRSSYHRHDDDLSIVLYCGEDWLIDSGAYSYAKRDPIREYMRSKWAHNVPIVVRSGRRNRQRSSPPQCVPMQRLHAEEGVAAARAISHTYRDHIAIRDVHVHAVKREFLVTDSLIPIGASGRERFLSLWHIPADKEVRIQGRRVQIVSRRTGNRLLIDNLGRKARSIGLLGPEVEGVEEPVVSWVFNETERAQMLVYEWFGKELQSQLRFRLLMDGEREQ